MVLAKTALGFLAASAVSKESDTIRVKEICGSLIKGFWKAYALLIKGTDVARATISTSSCLECGLDAWSCNNPLVNQRNEWESKKLSLQGQRHRKSEPWWITEQWNQHQQSLTFRFLLCKINKSYIVGSSLEDKAFLSKTYSNTLTTKRGCGESASLQRWCPLTPHPMAGWVGHTLAKQLKIEYWFDSSFCLCLKRGPASLREAIGSNLNHEYQVACVSYFNSQHRCFNLNISSNVRVVGNGDRAFIFHIIIEYWCIKRFVQSAGPSPQDIEPEAKSHEVTTF